MNIIFNFIIITFSAISNVGKSRSQKAANQKHTLLLLILLTHFRQNATIFVGKIYDRMVD